MNEAVKRLRRVRYIGDQTAKILYERKGIEGIEGLLELDQEELKDIHGVGEYKAKKILGNARELIESLKKCTNCGFYIERDEVCPYCKNEDRLVDRRTEDSIVSTFIKCRNELERPVTEKNVFYKEISALINRQTKRYSVEENLVDLFVNTRKKKRELDRKFRGIKERMRSLKSEEFVYSSHIESVDKLLERAEELEQEGRYHTCFDVLKHLDKGIEEMGAASEFIKKLDELVKSIDKEDLSSDFDIHLSRLNDIYLEGKFQKAKARSRELIKSIEAKTEKSEMVEDQGNAGSLGSLERSKNGKLNGSASSEISREKGFINGLENGSVGDSKEEAETGFINGLQGEKRSFKRKLRWKKTAGSILIFFLIVGMIAGTFIFFIYEEPDEEIVIDGDFEDWEDLEPLEFEMLGLSPSVTVLECAVDRSSDHLNYYFKTEGEALVGGKDRDMDAVYIFIQDGKGDNIYRTDELNAQYMVKIQGWGEDIFGQLYRYENETLDNNWHGWRHLSGLKIEKVDNEVEFSFPDMYLGDSEVHSQLVAMDHKGREGEAEHLISPDTPSFTVRQNRLDKEVLEEDDEILELVLTSGGGSVTVDSLEFDGEEDFQSIHLEPDLEFPLEMEGNEEKRISVRGIFEGDAGENIGLELVGVESDAVDRIVGPGAFYYFKEVPEYVVVDGAFGDWSGYEEADEGDVPNRIDIENYGIQFDDTDANFLLKTRDDILKGTSIPEGVERYVDDLTDSDGDGIPDTYDPYPNDFTNDGTPDSEMVTEEDHPDVDGDDVADYPHGSDKWLNTTIPEDPEIPDRYWGREVSRYIGPRPDPHRTGEDTIEVYIDRGTDQGNGMMASDGDYRIRIKGQYGDINDLEIERWSETESVWEKEDKELEIALSGDSMEFACYGLEGLLEEFEVNFITGDWATNRDSSSLKVGGSDHNIALTSTETDQNFYLRDPDVLRTQKGATESQVTLVNKDGEREQEWSTDELAGDFEITGDSEALFYLDPTTVGDNRPGLNATLSTETGVIGYGEVAGLSSEGWQTIDLEVIDNKISKGESLSLSTTITGPPDTGSLEISIYFNSDDRDSRLIVPTNTSTDVVEVKTYDGNGTSEDVFEGGDLVEVIGNVTHPIDADLIQRTEVSVYYPDGSVLIDQEEMMLYESDEDDPPFYSKYNHTFFLDNDTLSGSYEVEVTAWDDQDNIDTKSTFFSVPDDPGVSVYPDNHKFGEPGGNVNFTVNIKNIGNVDDLYCLEPSESSRDWTTNLYYNGSLIAEDIQGDGVWDWVDPIWDSEGDGKPEIHIEANQEEIFVFEKEIPEDTEGLIDETSFSAHSMNYSEVSDHAELATEVPLTEETKTFYLLENDILNTTMGNDTVETFIEKDGSHTWMQDPPMTDDFDLIDEALVHLYIEPYPHGHGDPDVTARLFEEGDIIGSDTIIDIEDKGWQTFSFSTDHTISTGNPMELVITTGDADITVHHNSEENNSRLEVETDTYIEVLDVKTYDGEEETDEFSEGDEVRVETKIGDPIGSYDIAGANVSIYSPDGTVMIENHPMNLTEVDPSDPSYWVNFSHIFNLPEEAQAGTYEIKVEAVESNGVISFGYGTFSIPADVDVYPDHNDTAEEGSNVTYNHTIQNMGYGTDIFHLQVISSQGFNVSLYSEQGELIAQDIDGDRDWDYVNPDWDTTSDGIPDTGWMGSNESIEVYLEIEIPSNTGNVTDETDIRVGSYYSDAYDEAADVTRIPEFGFSTFTISIFFILIFNVIVLKICKCGKFSKEIH
ncbi:MAG: helix-hairpin-helix domain-containing protein [Candidatus Saliniplasma sp.]